MSLNNFLKQISTGDEIKDFTHASKTFVDGSMRLHPKHAFSYHVFFDITNGVPSSLGTTGVIEAGMMVKNVDLPSYQMEVKKYNSYNRTNLSQSKISYNPVAITFHDDMADIVRGLWYDYYSYYYGDSRQVESVYGAAYKYDPTLPKINWGYSSDAAYPYFSAIRIYQLHQKKFSEYTLINPIITEWQHGRQDSSSSDPVEHKMTVQFETVKYAKGNVLSESVKGFGDLHYDQSPSPLTPAGGGTNSLVGPGGILDAASSIATDLAEGDYVSAGLSAIRTAENFKGADFNKIIQSEFKTSISDILKGKNPAQRFYTPTNKSSTTTPKSTATQYPEP